MNTEIFVGRLHELLKARGLTQRYLANAINVAEATISRWGQGKGKPRIKTVCDIASVLHVSTDYLLGVCDDINGINEKPDYFLVRQFITEHVDSWNDKERAGLISVLLKDEWAQIQK